MSTDDEYKIQEKPSIGQMIVDLIDMLSEKKMAEEEASDECKDICTMVLAARDLEESVKLFKEFTNYRLDVERTLGAEKAARFALAVETVRTNLNEVTKVVRELAPLRIDERDVWKKRSENDE